MISTILKAMLILLPISGALRKQYALALFAVNVIFLCNFRKILLDKFSFTSFFITQIRKPIIFYFYMKLLFVLLIK